MAPDLNSVPASPRTRALSSHSHSPPTSRRPSQMTGTPLLPGVTSSNTVVQDNTSLPVRHPRQLTAAELHLELEKEQEAVVNRLTRELAALRTQSASVVSNTSSSSTNDNAQNNASTDAAYGSSTRHRSSSNLSSRSNRSATSQPPSANPSTTSVAAVAGTSQASVDRARDAAGIGVGVSAGIRSRENSLAGMSMPIPTRSRAPSASPNPSPLLHHQGLQGAPDPTVAYFPSHSHRLSMSSTSSATARYEEAATAKAALEVAKKENDMLAARVRELEGMLRGRQGAEGEDGRSRAEAQDRGTSREEKDERED